MYQKTNCSFKATCLQNIFSVFRPKSTIRVLSDKKMQRNKKINLSIIEDKKSKSLKKLTVLQSIHAKETPNPTVKYQYNTKQQSTNTKIKHQQIIQNKGLNFHPRKIIVNQNFEKLKIKTSTQVPLYQLPIQYNKNTKIIYPLNNHYEYNKSQEIHKIENKIQPKFFNVKFNHHFDQNSVHDLVPNPVNNSENSFNNITNLSKNQETQNTVKQQQTLKNEMSNKQKQQYLPPTYPTSQKQQSGQSIETIKNESFDRNYKFLLNQIQQQQNQNLINSIDLQTPKNLIKKSHSQFHQNNSPLPKIQKRLTNLFEGTTIKSKEGSSQRQESVIYSNVIQRMNIDQLKFHTNCNSPLKPKKMSKQESLNVILFKKFQDGHGMQRKTDYEGSSQKMNILKDNYQKDYKQYKKMLFQEKKANNNTQNQYLFMKTDTNSNNRNTINSNSTSNRNNNNILTKPNTKQKSIYNSFLKITYLGVNRYANIYLCSIKQLNFIFAMKQIYKFTISFNKLEQQLKKQILIQYNYSHSNILNLYNIWQDDKKYYLAIEYGSQTLLNKIKKKSNIPQDICIDYIYEILKGLDYLHQHGIIHRDIKPQNIILCDGVCKISDFGLATQISSKYLDELCQASYYQCPQILKSQKYSVKADCWSLGVLAYQLINGKLNENLFTNDQTLNRDKLTYTDSVSDEYQTLIYFLLAPDEEERPTAGQLLKWEIFRQMQ